MSLVEINRLGIPDRGRVRRSSRGPGLYHRLRPRAGICSVRETAAVVNYTYRYPRRSSGRIILPRLCHRAAADDWSRTVLVGNDSTGYFFAWPLVRRRGKYSDRAYSGYNLNGILFVALCFGSQHDRPRFGGLCCQRATSIVFLAEPNSSAAKKNFQSCWVT